MQDCGIRNKGASPTSSQYAEQPKSHGQARLRSRGNITLDLFSVIPSLCLNKNDLSNANETTIVGSRSRTALHRPSASSWRIRRSVKSRRLRRWRIWRWSCPCLWWRPADLREQRLFFLIPFETPSTCI